MRHNDKYGDSCTHYWPEKVTKVKSAMALHLKIYFMSCTNYVQNFMLLSKSAQFLATLLYYNGCSDIYQKRLYISRNMLCSIIFLLEHLSDQTGICTGQALEKVKV